MVLLRVTSELSVAVVDAAADRLLILQVLFVILFVFTLLLVVIMLLHVLVLGGGGLLGLEELGLELADSLRVHLNLLLGLIPIVLRPLAPLLFVFDFELPLPLLEISKLHLVIEIFNASYIRTTGHLLELPQQMLLLLQLIHSCLFTFLITVLLLLLLVAVAIVIIVFVLVRAKEVTLTKLITVFILVLVPLDLL